LLDYNVVMTFRFNNNNNNNNDKVYVPCEAKKIHHFICAIALSEVHLL